MGGCALVTLLLIPLWRPLLAITVHEELARVEGLPVAGLRLTLMLLIALVIALAMKIVGVLLITSLLIIPAATAQRHARTPEQMAVGASLLGLLAVGAGNGIESVYIPEAARGTLCVSSQVGCALECAFCATGRQGFNRNLTVAEIIGQLWWANHALGRDARSVKRMTGTS